MAIRCGLCGVCSVVCVVALCGVCALCVRETISRCNVLTERCVAVVREIISFFWEVLCDNAHIPRHIPLCHYGRGPRGREITEHMQTHPNIDKSAFRKGEFVGYCNGAQRIRRGGQGWETYSLGSSAGTFTYATAGTLFELGGKLAHIAGNTTWNDHKSGITI